MKGDAYDIKPLLDILALEPDLFFSSRLRSLSESMGRSIQIVDSLARFEAEVVAHRPSLVLIDLGASRIDAPAAVRSAKKQGVPLIVVFGPHKDLAARAAALAAGADRWLTNQNLLTSLTSLLGTSPADPHLRNRAAHDLK
jgi:DNA-binding response OmpR family regulator